MWKDGYDISIPSRAFALSGHITGQDIVKRINVTFENVTNTPIIGKKTSTAIDQHNLSAETRRNVNSRARASCM